jgi:hypothetical protein
MPLQLPGTPLFGARTVPFSANSQARAGIYKKLQSIRVTGEQLSWAQWPILERQLVARETRFAGQTKKTESKIEAGRF